MLTRIRLLIPNITRRNFHKNIYHTRGPFQWLPIRSPATMEDIKVPEFNEKGPGKRPRTPSPLSKEEKQAKRAKSIAKATAKRLKKQRGHIPEQATVEDVRWKDIVVSHSLS